jgi:hypothetical protein
VVSLYRRWHQRVLLHVMARSTHPMLLSNPTASLPVLSALTIQGTKNEAEKRRYEITVTKLPSPVGVISVLYPLVLPASSCRSGRVYLFVRLCLVISCSRILILIRHLTPTRAPIDPLRGFLLQFTAHPGSPLANRTGATIVTGAHSPLTDPKLSQCFYDTRIPFVPK